MNSRPLLAIFAVLASLSPSTAFGSGGIRVESWCALQYIINRFNPPPPIVTSFFPTLPGAAQASPGGLYFVQGKNFGGPVPGKVIMHIPDSSMSLMLDINFWDDTLIVGNIPMITGVTAQTVWFEVINTCGTSNVPPPMPDVTYVSPWQVQFNPTMDMQQIPAAKVSCSMTSNHTGDSCMSGQPQFPHECLGLSSGDFPGTGVFYGIHNSGWGSGNNGIDSFTANLQNTWTVQSVNSFNASNVNGGNNTWANLSYSGSGNSWSVQWSEDSCTALGYSGSVTITGPLGVPY
jgi:hypothetical protein